MSDLMTIIKERRSIRKYKSDPLPKELIDRIMEAGVFAASGMGKQAPIIIAVTNRELRDKIAEENRKIGGWEEGFDPFYGAPVILIVASNLDARTAVYDGSVTLGNMMLMAHELGLSTCWIHRAKEEFASDFGKEILDSLGIEGDYEGVGHLALGYIDGDMPAAHPRKPGRTFYIE
ncbi:MAG: nitroreductase [Oscillospiraceae bacterium]|nr:nitroreductase [Oscillospiraceae bacterium]